MLQARLRLLLATLWTGAIWTVGYLVAPTLFATLADRVLAGTVAASMFRSEAWLGMACAVLMLLLVGWSRELAGARRRQLIGFTLCILVLTLVSHFGLQPHMAALREAAGPGGVIASASKTEFGIFHGVASALYLIKAILAGFLIVKSA